MAEETPSSTAETCIGLPVVEHRASGQTQPRQGHRTAEIIVGIQRQVYVLAACITLPDNPFQRRVC